MKNTKPICMALAAAVLAGCKTQEMSSTPFYTGDDVKYTDKVEDRVSLWPLLYHRAPVTSVAWPIFSSADDHVAIRPLYSQYMKHSANEYNEFNVLWPIAQFDTYRNDSRIFPFFWGKNYFVAFPAFWNTDDVVAVPPVIVDKDGDGMVVLPCFFANWKNGFNTLFPLWWLDCGGAEGNHTFWAAAGLGGSKSRYWEGCKDAKHYSPPTSSGTQWLLPLFWHSSSSTSGAIDHELFWAAAGLGGYERHSSGRKNHWLLPLYVSDGDDLYTIPYSRIVDGESVESYFMAGLGGHKSAGGKYDSSWLFPLYCHEAKDGRLVTPLCYRDGKTLVTPIYGHTEKADWLLPLYYRGENSFVTPIFGSAKDVNWAVPLYWQDEHTFLSLAWSHYRGADGKLDAAVSPLLLSGYNRDRKTGDSVAYLLAGLAGRAEKKDGTSGSWVFPLFYKDADAFFTLLYGRTKTSEWLFPLYYREGDTFVTPIAGRTKDSAWVLPLYVRDENSFTSLAYASTRNPKTGEESVVIPPLLAGCSWSADTKKSSWMALAGLTGSKSAADGSHDEDWLLPLWHHREGRDFASLPFGWTGGGTSQTNRWWLTPLVGTKSGREEGFWVEPVCSHSHSGDFARIESIADAKTLPDDITFHEVAYTNYRKQVSMRLREDGHIPSARTKTKVALFFTPNKRSASAELSWDGGEYRVRDSVERGNEFALHSERTRTVEFDPRTRAKKGEHVHETSMLALGALYNSDRTETEKKVEEGSRTLLGLLYNRRREVDKVKNTEFEERNVLLKVWQRAEKNGDVSIDAFPGFTYDSKKNGYRKLSLLWRLFRHVNDPEKGTSLDLLFIPLARP